MDSNNFLPKYEPSVDHGRLLCLRRGKSVSATPEEGVRQRVLHWLMDDKGWDKDFIELERSYPWVGDPQRHRIRSDIEILNKDRSTLVVVECKEPRVLLDLHAKEQALEYGLKSRAEWIWITNGNEHKFFKRGACGDYEPIDQLSTLIANIQPPQARRLQFPNLSDEAAVKDYFKDSFPDAGYAHVDQDDQKAILLSVHKALFYMDMPCPFSYGGVHVLEDRGIDVLEFGTGGGKWRGLYRNYIAATFGRVEAMSVTVRKWNGKTGGILLFVGVRKPSHSHHALQMNLQHCAYTENQACWEVHHKGRMMSQIKNVDVLAAVKEAGKGEWLQKKPGSVYLGNLHDVRKGECTTPEESKNLLANLLHYSIIRSNLRDADAIRKRQKKRM